MVNHMEELFTLTDKEKKVNDLEGWEGSSKKF